ncbi:MAG: hypothetical protein GY926_26335 [bacterium]|nr:hypothetical protein [bacterium]MCP4968733.1 hypothetical protein [bacterium]
MRTRRIMLMMVPLLLVVVLIASASLELAKPGGNRFEIAVFPVLEADIPIDQGWVPYI